MTFTAQIQNLVTTYTLSGPGSGTVASAATFTLTLGTGLLTNPVQITPSASNGDGTFSPTSITLTNTSRSATFTYTPTLYDVRNIVTTNNGNLSNPAPFAFIANSSATSYSLTSPNQTTGPIGTATGAFAVALPPQQTVGSPVTVTPNDGGAGGTFTPSSVVLSNANPTATFTYTAAKGGTITIATTNNGGRTILPRRPSRPRNLVTTYTLSGPVPARSPAQPHSRSRSGPAGSPILSSSRLRPRMGMGHSVPARSH